MKNNKGYFLIEIIVIIVMISICLLPIVGGLRESTQRAVDNGVKTVAIAHAEAVMEELLNQSFLALNNTGTIILDSPFSDYSYEGLVYYVTASDLNTQVTGPTEYKRIQVNVYYNATCYASITGLRADYN